MRLRNRPAQPKERAILATEPPLDVGARMCRDAWIDLDSCRLPEQRPKATKAGVIYVPVSGPVPYTAIIEWGRLHELDADSTRLVAEVIRILDIERAERIDSELRTKR